MILWTIQYESTYKTLQKKGVFRCDLRSKGLPDFKNAYDWMVSQMIQRVGPKPRGVVYPIWAWRRWDGDNQKPNLGSLIKDWGRKGRRFVRLELEIPDKDVLLSNFDAWHYVLNNCILSYSLDEDLRFEKEYDSLPEAEGRKLKEKTWERVFDVRPLRNDYLCLGEGVQATFWELRMEYVRKATPFVTKSPVCDSQGRPFVSCTTNASRRGKNHEILKPARRVHVRRPKKRRVAKTQTKSATPERELTRETSNRTKEDFESAVLKILEIVKSMSETSDFSPNELLPAREPPDLLTSLLSSRLPLDGSHYRKR